MAETQQTQDLHKQRSHQMQGVAGRLNRIEAAICDPAFRQNKGLGNEVGYYIFDYSPKDELTVRGHVRAIIRKVNHAGLGFQVHEFDLYEMILHILQERGYLEKCFEFERSKGRDHTFEAISKMLRLSSKDNLLVRHVLNHTTPDSVVFLTGVGKCFPIVRSHNVLNNLHQVLDTVPVVMFFPGEYSGQELRLFGTIKDDNYYRAFRLI